MAFWSYDSKYTPDPDTTSLDETNAPARGSSVDDVGLSGTPSGPRPNVASNCFCCVGHMRSTTDETISVEPLVGLGGPIDPHTCTYT